MSPYGTGRTMVNIHGAPGDTADRARAWTPEVHADLLRLKHAHDPSRPAALRAHPLSRTPE